MFFSLTFFVSAGQLKFQRGAKVTGTHHCIFEEFFFKIQAESIILHSWNLHSSFQHHHSFSLKIDNPIFFRHVHALQLISDIQSDTQQTARTHSAEAVCAQSDQLVTQLD